MFRRGNVLGSPLTEPLAVGYLTLTYSISYRISGLPLTSRSPYRALRPGEIFHEKTHKDQNPNGGFLWRPGANGLLETWGLFGARVAVEVALRPQPSRSRYRPTGKAPNATGDLRSQKSVGMVACASSSYSLFDGFGGRSVLLVSRGGSRSPKPSGRLALRKRSGPPQSPAADSFGGGVSRGKQEAVTREPYS